MFSGFCSAGSLGVSCVDTRLLVCKPFLGAVRGGTGRVQGAWWLCLWALDLVEVRGGRACGETCLLMWLFGVSCGDTWLFLPNLVEVWDVGCLCRETLVSRGCSSVP
ncbi:hypothetical protein Taro_044687 [Colocasia esculenta]|uniref:Uncharacterized protein n=1 Tax=Colocasia esculenta TaxID=4460 RepID=A0A843WUM9_COLES|nr:hypothetical protein [Colocasia esculenta]